jgi:transcriptional regulator with XRE-family HTH domain
VPKRPADTAVHRLKARIADLIDQDRHRPAGLRRTQKGLADHIGVAKSTLNEMLNEEGATQGALARLDKIADYFGVTPTMLVRRSDTALVELKTGEFRLLTHWRRLPASVQQRIMEMFDFFAGLAPEEQEARRLWHRYQLIRSSTVRAAIDKAIQDALRAQRYGPSEDTVRVDQGSSGETAASTPFPQRTRADHDRA